MAQKLNIASDRSHLVSKSQERGGPDQKFEENIRILVEDFQIDKRDAVEALTKAKGDLNVALDSVL